MSKYHKVALIPGELNGKTVTNAALKLLDVVKNRLYKQIEFTEFPYDADYFLKNEITKLGKKELDELKEYNQILKGPVGDPTKIKPGVVEVGIILELRKKFDQYVNRRPVILPEGVPSVIVGKTYQDINFEICRENTEGLYSGIGWIEHEGTEDEVACQVMKCTYKGVKRLAEFAEQLAFERQKGEKPTLHFVFKTNVLTYAAHPWVRVYNEYKDRKDIIGKYIHIDACIMKMITNPEIFDVVVTENMFGDILTDLGATISGGIGTGVSGNINPTGEFPSMFEPIHGSVPDKWYEQKENGEYIPGPCNKNKVQQVKPEGMFLAASMMLQAMKENKAAKIVKEAALNNIRDPKYKVTNLDQLIKQACNYARNA